MPAISEYTIGEITARDYRAAGVFEKFGLDFCCKGDRTIEEACKADGLDAAVVYAALDHLGGQGGDEQIAFNEWPLDLLADYIEKKHHRYVSSQVPLLETLLEKICRVHGKNHEELLDIRRLFQESAGELLSHMGKEENILFPFIRKMAVAQQHGTGVDAVPFGTVGNPISMMMAEHDMEGERFRQIAALSNNYTVPADGCTTYQVAFATLKAFEHDLHRHIHLENNILFPKAILLEKALRQAI